MEALIEQLSCLTLCTGSVREAYELMLKLLENIQKNPRNDKFRLVKKSNPKIRSKLFLDEVFEDGNPFVALMLLLGFTETGDSFSFPDSQSIKLVDDIDLLRGIIESIKAEEDEAPRLLPCVAVSSCSSKSTEVHNSTSTSAEGSSATESSDAETKTLPTNDADGYNYVPTNGLDALNAKSTENGTTLRNRHGSKLRKEQSEYERSQADLRQLRAEQAARFQRGEDPQSGSGPGDSESSKVPPRGGGGVSGFFSSIFGSGGGSGKRGDDNSGSSRQNDRRNSRPGGLRMKTLKDITPPPPRGGG